MYLTIFIHLFKLSTTTKQDTSMTQREDSKFNRPKDLPEMQQNTVKVNDKICIEKEAANCEAYSVNIGDILSRIEENKEHHDSEEKTVVHNSVQISNEYSLKTTCKNHDSKTVNLENNIRYKAWKIMCGVTTEFTIDIGYNWEVIYNFLISCIKDEKHEVVLESGYAEIIEEFEKNNEEFPLLSDLELMTKFRDTFNCEMRDLAVAEIIRAEFNCDKCCYCPFTSSIKIKIAMILEFMQKISDNTNDIDIKRILAKVHNTKSDYEIKTDYLCDTMKNIAFKNKENRDYRITDKFNKTEKYMLLHNTKEAGSTNDVENVIIYTSAGLNEYFKLYLLFCDEKYNLAKCYAKEYFDGQEYDENIDEIDERLNNINKIVDKVFLLCWEPNKYWSECMLSRIHDDVKECFVINGIDKMHVFKWSKMKNTLAIIKKEFNMPENDEVQRGNQLSMELEEMDKNTISRSSEEKKDIIAFYAMCNLIQKKFLESTVEGCEEFELHTVTQAIPNLPFLKRCISI